MNALYRILFILVSLELLSAGVLCGLRLNSTRLVAPPVESYTDAITSAELLALPDRFLFDNTRKWRVLGETYLKTGFLHQAAACLSRAAAGEPRSAEIALLHGYCLDRVGELDQAQAEYQRAARLDRGLVNQTAWYFQGRAFLQRELPDEAMKAFEKAGDDHLPSVFQRAKLHVRSGRLAAAAPLLQRLANDLPEEVRVWQFVAQLADAVGTDNRDAIDAGEQARPLLWIHHLPPGLSVLTEEFGMAREFNEALKQQGAGDKLGAASRMLALTREEIRWQNSNPWLLQTVAAECMDAGDLVTARQLLDQQIHTEGFPTARAWNLLGLVEHFENRHAEAAICWRKSQFMNPATVDYDKFSLTAKYNGDLDSARIYQALALQYASITALLNKSLDVAQPQLRQAVDLAPELAQAWYSLGEAERLLGNSRVAQQAYQHCLSQKPGHGRAHARLASGRNGP